MKQQKYSPLAADAIRQLNRNATQVRDRRGAAVTALDRWLVRTLAVIIGRPPVTFTLWDGQDAWQPDERSAGRVVIHDRDTLVGIILSPELAFGDAYTTGRLEFRGDPVEILHRAFVRMENSPLGRFRRNVSARLPRPWRGTLADSKKNIHHHYDLGNDFYRLWLDEDMVYTCAYYPAADARLEEAQAAKMDLVCRKAGLKPGLRVVEAGCGWGSLAIHMARNYGVRVKAFNISREQVRFARDRARAEGLADRVEFIEDDYRNIAGEFDAFVSVGMLEHVGPENYRTLGAVIDRCLKPEGRGLIHSIGRNRRAPVNPWTDKRIFPGSHPPSLREMMDIFEPFRLSVLDVENLRLHYARTLMDWLARFDAAEERVRAMYDNAFVRAWRLYLASSAAAFLAGNLQLFQVVFARSACNDLPLGRGYMQTGADPEHWSLN